jgi:hypothetical protein
MIMAAALSAILMLDSRFSKHHRDAAAIEATVLATESVLNAAFAHYQRSGSWPRESSGSRCAVPFERLNFSVAPRNGWGEDISVQSSCRYSDSEYVLEQRVPAKWTSHLRERLDGTIHSATGDFATLRVSMDRSGGASSLVMFGRLGSASDNPLRFTYAPCAKGSPHHFSSMMSAFAYEYTGATHLINGFRDVFNGMRIVEDASSPGSVSIKYNMYRYREIGSVGDITENSAVVDMDTGSPELDDLFESFSLDLSDGNKNAVHRCDGECSHPERTQSIKVGFFSWCE